MQTRKDDSAFPIFDSEGMVDARENYSSRGMTKREYFAALALQGLLASNKYLTHLVPTKAVQLADDLIKELNAANSIQLADELEIK